MSNLFRNARSDGIAPAVLSFPRKSWAKAWLDARFRGHDSSMPNGAKRKGS